MPNENAQAKIDSFFSEWHEKLLVEALKWRQDHPEFTFSLRTAVHGRMNYDHHDPDRSRTGMPAH